MLLRNDNSNYIASTVGKIADAGLRTVAHHTVYHFFFFKCKLPSASYHCIGKCSILSVGALKSNIGNKISITIMNEQD